MVRPGSTDRVSVVLLSYNRPAHLEQALASVRAQTHSNLEVIVVDNRSAASDEVAALVRSAPGVRLVAYENNRGFTGGMNGGLAAASGPYVLLTEDDLVLDPECAARFLAYQRQHPEAGLLTGLMLNLPEGTVRCAGGEVRLGPCFELSVFGADQEDRGQFAEPLEVAFIPGALMFGRRDFLQQLGGFREDFFMYLEDVELCLRVARAGRRIIVVPQARAHHHRPASGPSSSAIQVHKIKNLLALYLLHARGEVLPGFLARYALAAPLKLVFRNRRQAGAHLRAIAWVARRLPMLLRQRFALRRGQGAPEGLA